MIAKNQKSLARTWPIFKFTVYQSVISKEFWKSTMVVGVPMLALGFALAMLFANEADPDMIQGVLTEVESLIGSNASAASSWITKVPDIAVRLVFAFSLFFCMVTFVQTIAKTLMEEKSSKLMETLLNDVSPYALVLGKVGGMTVLALGQLVLWILMTTAGLRMGELLAAGSVSILEVSGKLITLLLHTIRHAAWRTIFCILAYLVGFVMYCTLAGFFNSFAGKPEDLSSTVGVYATIIIISILLALGPAIWFYLSQGTVLSVFNYIPPCAPFCLPASILLGQMTIPRILISLVLMIAMTVFLIYATGKIYKAKVFYRGGSPFDFLFRKKDK